MRADSFAGKVLAVISRRAPAFQPRTGEPSSFAGTVLRHRTDHSRREPESEGALQQDDDQTNLLFRIYIPSNRLYETETNRLLSLFRDWAATTRGQNVRRSRYRTASGEIYEFFTQVAAERENLLEEFDSFSDFLTLSTENPSAAADLLASTGLGPASSTELVSRFGRAVRRLQIDLQHERERRILDIRQRLEEQLLESGADLPGMSSDQLNAVVDSLVPEPPSLESLAPLTARQLRLPTSTIILNINRQFISAIENAIVQNVQGTLRIRPQAKQLLAVIERYGGEEAAILESAVYELEDPDISLSEKSRAKHRLDLFLGRLGGAINQVEAGIFFKYLESVGVELPQQD